MNASNSNVERKPIVWICHDKGGLDFSKAAAHGELRAVFKGIFNPFDLAAAKQHAEQVLADSQPSDWIIGVGNGIAQMLVAAEFIHRHDRLPVLVYHTQKFEYVKRDLSYMYT